MTSSSAAGQSPSPSPPLLKAGVGKREITAETPGRPVLDPLLARALVFDNGALRIALVTMDAVAIGGICDISDDFLPQLRQRVERELGIPGNRVIVNASHTHPPDRILCEEGLLLERTLDAIRQAVEGLVEVTTRTGRGHEDRLTMNRNLRLKNGRHWTIRHANPCPPDEEVEGVGPIDPAIGLLCIDRLDGRPLAVVYNYALHLLFADTHGSISANIPGIASRVVEESIGDGVTAFFLQGAAGDVIDTQFKNFHQPRDIGPMGLKLGESILRAWRSLGAPCSAGSLNFISRTVLFPRRTDIPERIAALEAEQDALLRSLRFTSLNLKSFLALYLQQRLNPDCPSGDSYATLQAESVGAPSPAEMDRFNRANLDKYLENLRAMESLARIQDELETHRRHAEINRQSGSDTVPAEITGLRIGDFVLITAPLEVLTQVSLRLKAASPHPHTYLAAFTNGYLHYGPPADDYDKGGYEVIECFLAPEWEGVFQATAMEILRQL